MIQGVYTIQRYVHIPIIYPFIRFTLPETSSKFALETLGVGSDEFPFGFWPPALSFEP